MKKTPKLAAPFVAVSDEAENATLMMPQWARTAGDFAREWSAEGTVQDLCTKLRGLLGEKPTGRSLSTSEFMLPPQRIMQTLVLQGFHLRLGQAGDAQEQREKMRLAMQKKAPWLGGEAALMMRDLTKEWFLCDSVCAFWKTGGKRKSGAPALTVLDTERIVRWEDGAFGEMLEIQSVPGGGRMPGAKKESFGAKWADAMQAGKPVVLSEKDGEFYRIRTRGKRGAGLARPGLEGALPLFGMLELLSLADRSAAWEHRNLITQWLIGHDIRYGPRSGMADHFIKPGHVASVKKKMAGKVGPTSLYTNFDWTVKHVFLPPEYFNKEKYAGGMMRLENWFGPVGKLLRAEIHDNDIALVRAWVDYERAILGGLAEDILNSPDYWAGKVPKERISVGWSPVTMLTPKSVLELVRFASAQGAIGAQTTREMLGLDHEEEQARLAYEAAHREGNVPYWEAKQGQTPAPGSTEKGGRPAEH